MRPLFIPGDPVINTRTHESSTIIAVIPNGPNSVRDLYVLLGPHGYYIVDDEELVVYDKRYWDELPSGKY